MKRGSSAPGQGLLFAAPEGLDEPLAQPRRDGSAASGAAAPDPGARIEPTRPRGAAPGAAREIRLGEHRIGYSLRRARRRSIGFVVADDGLTVKAPTWVSLREVEAAVQTKADWIVRKLQEQQDRARRRQQARIEWRDGTTIPFLGESVVVRVEPGAAGRDGAVLNPAGAAMPGAPTLTLHVALAPDAPPAQLRDAVQSWLQRQARRVFEERCSIYAERLGVRMARLALSSAQTRWGSASTSGAIRLNWRLIHFPLPTIDYVVAHELAHLREMNHSPRFWNVVRSVLPDYELARQALRSQTVPQLD